MFIKSYMLDPGLGQWTGINTMAGHNTCHLFIDKQIYFPNKPTLFHFIVSVL